MSSSKQSNIDKIFREGPVLSADLILDYLDDKLVSEKRHRVEKALIDDPFLAEALEGLEGMSSQERKTIIYNLLGKEEKEAVIIPYRLIGIAAATLIGISTIFFITKSLITTSTEDTIAYKEVEENVSENTSKSEPIENATEDKITIEEENKPLGNTSENDDAENEPEEQELEIVNESPVFISTEEIKKPVANASPKKSLDFDSSQTKSALKKEYETITPLSEFESDKKVGLEQKAKEGVKRNPQELALNMIKTLKSKTSSSSYNVAGAVSRSAEEVKVEDLSKKEVNALENYTLGVTAFNKGDYRGSQEKLETAYKKDDDVGDVKYFLAASYLLDGNNFSKAKKVFQAEKTQSLTQEKQWLQAIIYLNDGKVDVAKSQLEKISTTNSVFKQEADNVLKDLE